MNRENSSHIIRTLAGGYLLYLAYSMIKTLRAGEVDNQVITIGAIVLFIVSGAGILYIGIKGMVKQSQTSEEKQADANLNENLELEEELYDEFVEPGLSKGQVKGIEQELAKLKDKDAKDIIE